MARIVDNVIALRIIYLLSLPFSKWPACKDGIIDEDGNVLKKADTDKEKGDWTMLHRLIHKLKTVVGLVPGGKSLLGGLAASYLLMKEDATQIQETMDKLYELAPDIMEDIANATTVGSVGGSSKSIVDPNIVRSVDNPYTRRNEKRAPGPDVIGRRVLGFKEWMGVNK